jgi:type VI secretion system secreted protein Hcp
MEAVAEGKHFPGAILTVRKAGSEQVEHIEIKMSDILVSSYRQSGQVGCLPTDEFSLTFAKVEFKYVPQKADGSADTPVIGSLDLKEQDLASPK